MKISSPISDEDLVRSAQQGTLDAFTILYERYLPVVYRRVRYTVPEQDVDDITQEVFIAVMRSLKGFRGDSLFSTWLRTLVRRQVADYYRRRNPADVEAGMVADPELAMETVAGASLTNLDDCILVRQALKKLPDKYSEILLLRFAEGMRFHEIAEVQGQSLEATKSLFRRAVAALEKQLEDRQ